MSHTHFQNATVTKLTDDEMTLELPDGTTITWPRTADYMGDVSEGDTLTLTLTRSTDFMDELLGVTDGKNS